MSANLVPVEILDEYIDNLNKRTTDVTFEETLDILGELLLRAFDWGVQEPSLPPLLDSLRTELKRQVLEKGKTYCTMALSEVKRAFEEDRKLLFVATQPA